MTESQGRTRKYGVRHPVDRGDGIGVGVRPEGRDWGSTTGRLNGDREDGDDVEGEDQDGDGDFSFDPRLSTSFTLIEVGRGGQTWSQARITRDSFRWGLPSWLAPSPQRLPAATCLQGRPEEGPLVRCSVSLMCCSLLFMVDPPVDQL